MVSVVFAVDLTGDVYGLALEIFKTDERTGTIGHYGVTVIFVGTCVEVRKHGNGLELVSGFVEFDTVRRESDFYTVFIDGVFERHTESRRSCVVTGVVGEVVVIVEFFVGVVRAMCFNNFFNQFKKYWVLISFI